MSIFEIVLMAVALAMDAFAVAICKGLATKEVQIKHMLVVGAWFGIFQALMPFIGCTIGAAFLSYIEAIDHWIAFVLHDGLWCTEAEKYLLANGPKV